MESTLKNLRNIVGQVTDLALKSLLHELTEQFLRDQHHARNQASADALVLEAMDWLEIVENRSQNYSALCNNDKDLINQMHCRILNYAQNYPIASKTIV